MKDLSPIGWAVRPLKRYAQFSGRSSRAEFWWFWLFLMIANAIIWAVFFAAVGFAAAAMSSQSPGGPFVAMFSAFGALGLVAVLFWLAVLIPMIAVQVRRLHDTGRSGWWLGAFWLLYVVYFVVTFGTGFAGADGSVPNFGVVAAVAIVALALMVYSIVLLVFWCLPGTEGPNRFGEDPYGPDVGQVFA